jgi:hypothetical protein
MSPKASPWRNGFQESFYAGFKADLKDICLSSPNYPPNGALMTQGAAV